MAGDKNEGDLKLEITENDELRSDSGLNEEIELNQEVEKVVGLRVIDEAEEAQEEVTRLEKRASPEVVSSRKVEVRKEREFLNTMAATVSDGSVSPDDHEEKWIREAAAAKARAVPIGWFILLILIFGGVLLWSAVQMWLSGEHPKTGGADSDLLTENQDALGSQFLNPQSEAEQKKEAEERYLIMEHTLRDYMAADTLEKKSKYVRHPERVRPLMEDYYSRNEMITRDFEGVSEYHIVSLENHPFIALRAELAGEKGIAVLLEEEKEAFKIDWESEVSYQPMSPETFREKRPDGAATFRFYVRPDHFYAYEFQDEQKWRCYKLTLRDSEEHFFGYVERGSLIDEEMEKATRNEKSAATRKSPLILKVSYPPAGRSDRLLKIEEIISIRWAYATNPDAIEEN